MESKRKANGGPGVGDNGDDRATKRRRMPSNDAISDLSQGETPETTTRYGLHLLESVKKTEDKSGRPVATNFLTLPSKRQLPDYYNVIKMPIAIDTIEAKLGRKEFPNLSALESYFKRMVSNAKEYNQRGSEIYDDAERLRKALSNFMTKTNPAYKNIPGYTAVPTPIPEPGDDHASDEDAEGEPDSEADVMPNKRRARPARNSQARASVLRHSSTPAVQDSQYAGVAFTGLTFQQAQEKIVSDIISHKEDEGDEFVAFEPFINLPPRSLKDYYQIIQQPLCLKKLQKRVLGIHGRNDSTGVSDFRSWAAFEEEASHIWENALQYNEDGSEISNLARDLQKSIQEARKAVAEPPAPKITLKMPPEPPKITLKLGRPIPNDVASSQPTGPVQDSHAAQNGVSRNPFTGSLSKSFANLTGLDREKNASITMESPAPLNITLKNEIPPRDSPAPMPSYINHRALSQSAVPPQGQSGSMPPPSTPGLSNHNPYSQYSYAQSYSHHTSHASNTGFESKWRQPGRDTSQALLTNLTITSHHNLAITRHFRMDVPPSDTLAQQSIAVNLPSTHCYVHVKPELAEFLRDRQYKLFVTAGNQRLHAVPSSLGHAADSRRPLFETRLNPGVNRIEVELIAALPKGAPKLPNGQDVELEKVTVFANLMRA